jgi:hypothetical protein
MTYQEKLIAAWKKADEKTADKRLRGKFVVAAKEGDTAGLTVESNSRRPPGARDADGDTVLEVISEGNLNTWKPYGWVLAPRPAAVPPGVETKPTSKKTKANED